MNNNIAKIVLDITNNIQLYEKSLKQFVKENINNTTDNIIKLNMQQTLYKNISDFTKKFKLNQEIYAKKYKELVFEGRGVLLRRRGGTQLREGASLVFEGR